jgi:tRNA-(ms[2]io[6]A)-hydroxylase
MVSAVPERPELVRPLTGLAQEETHHFFQVLAELEHRGLGLGRCPRDPYAHALQLRVQGSGLERLRDRLLVGSLIEARSCERFSLLAHHCADDRLRRLWGGLFEAEAEHHTLFLKLAGTLGGAEAARARFETLADEEAEIVAALPLRVAIH